MVIDKDTKRPYQVIKRNVNLETDKYSCSIYGITVLSGGEIIITDDSNRKVKLLSADYTVVDHVSVAERPLGICAVADNQVAVCNGKKAVQVYKVMNSQLKIDRKLQMDHVCKYVSYMAGQLYVSSKDTVYQYTLAGQRVRQVYTVDGEYVSGIAVSPDEDRLYVTDVDNNQLVIVNLQGQVLAKRKDADLQYPKSVCVSPRGRMTVYGRKSHTILQVDRSDKHKLSTLADKKDGVDSPLSVCFDSRTSFLLVGQQDNNDILVLKQ